MTLFRGLILTLFLPVFLLAKEPTICLNMIVKNESDVIERCLASVKPYIDHWVIVDTGSTDGTQRKIRNFMKDIPGELYERNWVNFSHNRNEAMELARDQADYFLFIDADETLRVDKSFKKEKLDRDLYVAFSHQHMGKFSRVLLANTKVKSKWEGVLHEVYQSNDIKTHETLNNVAIISTYNDGCRSKLADKFLKDAQVLEEGLKKEPNNERYVFYLAQCYNAANEYEKALKMYKKRVEMGGEEVGEVFYSQYQVGKLQSTLKMDPQRFIESYSKAFLINPTRVEPLYEIGLHYLQTDQDILAYIVAEFGLEVIAQNHHETRAVVVHLHNWIYDWGMELLYGDAAARLNKEKEAIAAYNKVIEKKDLPPDLHTHLKKVLARGE
ncbi:MAG: glycosyltransferase [Rhabdochlamydiaceae bacterium]|nr:glycosyltransferase [Candidatus Amphrikana amoebophyrae]